MLWIVRNSGERVMLMQPRDIPSLTGLRLFAALSVVCFHVLGGHDGLFWRGYLGVDLFFILSGFIIHHVYKHIFASSVTAQNYRSFLLFRFARIYPVHIFSMTLALLIFAAAVYIFRRPPEDPRPFTWPAVVSSLTMTNAWLGYYSPNIPAWSISAEWFAYLFYPFVALGFGRIPIIARSMFVPVCLIAIQFWANDHPLLRIGPEFLLGMAAYDLSERLGPTSRWLGLLTIGLIVLAIPIVTSEALGLRALLFAVLIVSLANPTDVLAQALSRPWIVYGGNVSYALYMTHGVVWTVVKNATRLLAPEIDPLYAPWIGVPTIVICLIFAALTYELIETPARRALRFSSSLSKAPEKKAMI